MPVSALLFDLDGTLVDSQPLIAATINRVLAARGHPTADAAVLDRLSGMPVEDVYLAVLPIGAADEIPTCTEEHRTLFHQQMVPLTRPMPGAPEVLAALARNGWRMAVITNRLTVTAEAMLRHCGLAEYFEVVHGFDLVPRPKPYPDLLLFTLAQMGLTPPDALVIGDSGADMNMAIVGGSPMCAVTWGALTPAVLLAMKPTYRINAWSELLDILPERPGG